MLKNILITSLRNFSRNQIFSLINLIGLSVSMSLGMLIIMIIKDQFAFDNFHKDTQRIYRVNTHVLHPEWGLIDFASTPLAVGEVLEDEYSLTDGVVRISRQMHGDASYLTVKVPASALIADQSFLEVFNFPLLKGDAATALAKPNSLVLTKQTAEKIFGTIDPVGQTISYGGYGDFTITGVLHELPGKTHLEFEMLCSIATLPSLEKANVVSASLNNWSAYYNNYVYVKLKAGRNPQEVERALAEINKKYCVGLKSEGRDIKYESFYLHALEKITPGPELADRMGKGMPAPFLIFLGVLAAVVLLMSVFNFTNLTIARSLTRAREIGVRKVVGANRSQVFLQFIGEAVVFALLALSFSYILLQFLKTGFMQLALSKDFSMDLKEDLSLYFMFIVFAVVVGILAGVLPASYLSAFKPARVLKDVQNLKIYARLTFRKILMVAQFTLSVIFVIVVLIIYRQVDFMLNADYGIEQKNNLSLNLKGVSFEKIANEIRTIPGVVRVGGVSHKLGTFDDNSSDYKKNKGDESFVMRDFMVDNNYIENLSLDFVAGRNFNPLVQTGAEKDIILNESALVGFGFQHPLDAIGQKIYVDDSISLQVIGVVKDFHFRPLNNRIGPLALRYNTSELSYLSANIHPSQIASATESIRAVWKKYDPNHPIDFRMMDQEIDDAYRQTGLSDMPVIVGYIAFLVVSLACLGMIGMAMYASQIRAKEVGIRKVMGASVTDMIMLLSKSYLALIGIAMLIGVPVSLMLGEIFLEEYPYRIQITPVLFAVGVAIIAGLGLLTVWSQTVKVAMSNPVKWLRNE
jgi:putative ABC transport system permease protein